MVDSNEAHGCPELAHRVISLPRSNLDAFRVKRTSTRAGHKAGFM